MNQNAFCAHCDIHLGSLKEIVSMEGWLFCCKDHAILYKAHHYETHARELAKEDYNSNAEYVSPRDVGIHPPSYEYLLDYIRMSSGCDTNTAESVLGLIVDDLNDLIEENLEVLQDEQGG